MSADVHLIATGKDEAIFAAAERIATELDTRLLATFPDATLVEFRGARTFVSWTSRSGWPRRSCAGCNSVGV